MSPSGPAGEHPSPGSAAASGSGPLNGGRIDDETRDWLAHLDGTGRSREEALGRLHDRRRGRQPITGPELDDLAHQAADDALVAITAKLGQFRGESRFTTWAYKFAVLEVSSKLGRHFWQHPSVPFENEDWERLPDRFGIDPGDHAQRLELIDTLRRAVQEELTAHQRGVFVAIIVDGIPLDALAIKLGSNRNAIYKTMYDARQRLRSALAANGYLTADETVPAAETPRGMVRRP
jgi:RNA polymerase sigma-70 factor, ECF subfamily